MGLGVICDVLLAMVSVTAISPAFSGGSLQLLDVRRKDLCALPKIAVWIVALIKYAEQ